MQILSGIRRPKHRDDVTLCSRAAHKSIQSSWKPIVDDLCIASAPHIPAYGAMARLWDVSINFGCILLGFTLRQVIDRILNKVCSQVRERLLIARTRSWVSEGSHTH